MIVLKPVLDRIGGSSLIVLIEDYRLGINWSEITGVGKGFDLSII